MVVINNNEKITTITPLNCCKIIVNVFEKFRCNNKVLMTLIVAFVGIE